MDASVSEVPTASISKVEELYVPLKHWHLCAKLHVVISQKIVILILTATKTSHLTFEELLILMLL
jgi:hypothetical protein